MRIPGVTVSGYWVKRTPTPDPSGPPFALSYFPPTLPTPILRHWQMLLDVSVQRPCFGAFGRSFKRTAVRLHIRKPAHIGY